MSDSQPPYNPSPVPQVGTLRNAERREATRLAPSPTGALHLGNARTFLATWALARQRGWKIVLRIEDLDGPRVKPGVIDLTIDLLQWLGMDWDEGPTVQSTDTAPYVHAMDALARTGAAYPSDLTRSEIEAAASAPQEGSHEVRFDASKRPPIAPGPFADTGTNWRFATPAGEVAFRDAFAGSQTHEPARTIGDFVVWTKRGQPSYQLAVVVDDHRQSITQVIRGDDLLDSAARQLLLYRALGFGPEPTYTHIPLVLGPDGKRLAKRHGDTRLDTYRARRVHPHRIIALVGAWCGIFDQGKRLDRLSSAEFRERFALTTIAHEPIRFTNEDDAWLLHGT